jgi:hypothetical protein
MFKFIKRLFDKILDDVVWVVVYPNKKISIKFTWGSAKDEAKTHGGKVWHCDDLENQELDWGVQG